MRMQRLFRDLDIQFEAEQLRTLENQAQRRARMEYMAVTMRERCAAQHGSRVKVCGTDGTVREGYLEAIGQGWIQISTGRENILIPESSILWWECENQAAKVKVDVQARAYRFSTSDACYALMMAQEPVRVSCDSPVNTMFEGVIARVGADFIEMTLSPCEPYSAYSNALAYKERGVRIIPTSRICAIVTVN